eukprot:TRINITY_DN8400_c0_g1_i1.p1 TRINITY_DN8400_c0_g1~~TRINITY_DN8400_c0_g1_i1.p1  ORF type:complete len:444 (+),score=99.21 TRINITY_DN8400_c0_g1_i1:72-1403(+)
MRFYVLLCTLVAISVCVFAQTDPPYDRQTTTYTPQYEPVSLQGQKVSVMPFFSPDHSIDTETNMIEEAQSSIDIGTPGFSSWSGCTAFESQCVGCTIANQKNEAFPIFPALINAKHRGVNIRILTNDYGTPTCEGMVAPLDYLVMNGIEVRFYASTTFMHAKYMNVDGKKTAISSVNYSYSSFMKNREAGVVLADGADELIAFGTQVFNGDWEVATEYLFDMNNYTSADWAEVTDRTDLPVTIPPPVNIPQAYVTPVPVPVYTQMPIEIFASPDYAYAQVLANAKSATQTFAIMVYQITEPTLTTQLINMHQAGINVTILVSDKIFDETDWKASQVCYKQLYEAGLTVRKCGSYYTYSHQKFWVVDNTQVGMSTGNWSPSDYPIGSSFPPFGSSSWQAVNRDYNVLMTDDNIVGIFSDVLNADYVRGSDWQPYSQVTLASVEL